MPRINIEEKWWSDPRRGRLSERVGRRYADGLMVEAWRLSQEFNGEPFNWKDYFDQAEVEHMSACGLASLEHDLIYVRGSKEHHEWVLSKRRNASLGGRKSAQLRQAPLEQHSSYGQPSSSYSYSNSNKNKKKVVVLVLEEILNNKNYNKYPKEFLTQEVEMCREWWWANNQVEANIFNFRSWTMSNGFKSRLSEFLKSTPQNQKSVEPDEDVL